MSNQIPHTAVKDPAIGDRSQAATAPLLGPCNPNLPVYNKHSSVTENGSLSLSYGIILQISMKRNSIAESLSVSALRRISIQSSRIFFPPEKSLITQILHFAMDHDKQAGLLTNLPAKIIYIYFFPSLPASSFAVFA